MTFGLPALGSVVLMALTSGSQSPSEQTQAAAVRPPRLQSSPDLPLIEDPNAPGSRRSIELSLKVDAQGEVVAVEPMKLDDPYVVAALENALQMRFFPATVGQSPVASRLRYRFVVSSRPRAPLDSPKEPPPAPVPGAQPPAQLVQIQAKARISETLAQRQSAEAVQSQSLAQARAQSNDMGRALARSEGVSFQRSAGMGSNVRVLLAGYSGAQLRYFIDTLPLAWSGYANRVSLLPAGLFSRLDVFAGVVPVRLASDALGGALHLITRKAPRGTHGQLSYELASFGNQRLHARLSHRRRRHTLSLFASHDNAQNRYPMRINVPDRKGVLSEKEVYRFHDAFQASRLRLSWSLRHAALRLENTIFAYDLSKELQSNLVMSVPFGEAHFQRQGAGWLTRARYLFGPQLRASLDLGLRGEKIHLQDTGRCRYNWYGQCILENSLQGEIGERASDQKLKQLRMLAMPKLYWNPAKNHRFVLASTMESFRRIGKDHALKEDQNDPLESPRTVFSTSTGLSYKASFWQDRLRNDLFAKLHTQDSSAIDFGVSDTPIYYDDRQLAGGWGQSLRFAIIKGLQVKGSYEWSARMPSPEERFGNGVLILPNLEISPERSHNFNLSSSWQKSLGKFGSLDLAARGYARLGSSLILLLGTANDLRYRNMLTSRVLGAQGKLHWSSRGDYLQLSSQWTWQRPENRSKEGDFSDYFGDRIPNQPYRWSHSQIALSWPEALFAHDRISALFDLRWVGEFYRTWESAGVKESKEIIQAQTTLSAGIGYQIKKGYRSYSIHLRVDNLANARVFDYFGVPKPPRSVASKASIEF